jgi:ribosome biogenesis protein Nip4
MTNKQHKYVFLHGPDMVKDAEGKDIMLHIRVAKNNDTLDLFGYKLTNVDEDADVEHWTWEFAAPFGVEE